MTPEQFSALAKLLRLRSGATTEAVRIHMVEGVTVPDAARLAGVNYQLALKAVYRTKSGIKLAKQVTSKIGK